MATHLKGLFIQQTHRLPLDWIKCGHCDQSIEEGTNYHVIKVNTSNGGYELERFHEHCTGNHYISCEEHVTDTKYSCVIKKPVMSKNAYK